MNRRRGDRLFLMFLCVAVLAACVPLTHLPRAVGLLFAVRRVAAADINRSSAVTETRIRRRLGASDAEGIVYFPANRPPESAVVLVAGISELGCYHPQLVSLARALAGRGFLVLTPDVKMFREFRIYPPPLDEISFWLHEARRIDKGAKLGRIGLAGISFSGTIALIAASRPENRSDVAYVLGVGAFDDLLRCSDFWFGAGPVTVAPGSYPTRYYARWVMMLAAIDMIPAGPERKFLQSVLHSLLVQKPLPSLPKTLSADSRRWYQLAVQREDETDPDLSQEIRVRLAKILYPALETAGPASEIRCPVFLAHGAYDDLIPAEESRRLQEKITHARTRLLISPFLTHTHPRQQPMSLWQRSAASIDILRFFYHLCAAVEAPAAS